ncbi:LacI family DNA-binding transcriptional regulator [Paenibacillus thermoaerophilus]
MLNGVGPIREETRRKVLEAAERLSYHPSAIARSFARRRSGNIGVVLPHVPKVHLFSTYYFSEVLSGIGEAVREAGYDLLLLFRAIDETPDYPLYYQTQKIDGCLLLGTMDTAREREALDRLAEQDLPFCLVNQHFYGKPYPSVDADHIRGAASAVRHLLELGVRRVAFVNGPAAYSSSGERLRGYRQALTEAGITFDPGLVLEGNYSRTSGVRAGNELLRRRGGYDAVFAANDRMAIGVMQAFKAAGVEAGRELPIAGYDDSDASRLSDPPLTTVKVPFYEMGRLAAERVIRRLSGDGAREETTGESRLLLPTELIVRQSTSNWGG